MRNWNALATRDHYELPCLYEGLKYADNYKQPNETGKLKLIKEFLIFDLQSY